MRSLEVIKSRKMVLVFKKAHRQSANDFYFGEQELQASMKVSSANFANNVSLVVGIVYTDLHEVLLTDQPIRDKTGKERHLDSRIIAVAMDPKPEALQENVILKFRNLRADEGEKKCVFWSGFSESSDGYSERGCHVVKSKKHLPDTVCSCNHLTHFAVLVDYNGSPKLTEKDTIILEIITYVGLSLSTTGILLTIIAYYFLTDVDQPLSQIRLNLSVAIGAGQIIFLAGINSTRDTTACVAVAALTQYFLMAAFCWMLIEAIYLYLLVVKVYNINEKIHMFHVISWGLPIIMVGISLSIAAGKEEIQSYTSDKYCWLSSADNLIWIFIAFVAFIEGLNILILVRVIKEMTTLVQPIEEANHIQQIRLGVRTCLVMFPLLGVTWLFGLFLPLHKAFAYIFTIFNSTQGFLIFALHCLRNSQIRERLKRKMNTIFPATVDHGKKTSKIDPNDAGDMWAVELQSFNE
ncbi:adhesion G protein-coupled receptor L4-like [Pocillopora verrucosa]|uniref:adhesion G protein-coupled receptor L4-like n=1 Tax=Pocillopora verrucosa TaxID=203993 RepID=UPI00334066C5